MQIPHTVETYSVSSGSKILVSRFGAQILSWEVNGKEILYQNSAAVFDGKSAIRAGMPICFPWFSKGAELGSSTPLDPSHGHVRTSLWDLIDQTPEGITFSTKTRSALGQDLKISVTYSVKSNLLSSAFTVENLTRSEAKFDLALHTYFTDPSPQESLVTGLDAKVDPLVVSPPIDQVFKNKSSTVTVTQTDKKIMISNTSFDKSVVWNPGTAKPKDLPVNPVVPLFLCVESLTSPILLKAGDTWQGSVVYRLI